MDASNELKQCKALLFDYFGTVVDWLTPVSKALIENAPLGSNIDWTEFAHKWRNEFFIYLAELADEHSSSEVIPYNDVNDHALSRIQKGTNLQWTKEQRVNLINSWGQVIAWEDSVEGLRRLRKKYIVTILSNGSTRKLIDTTKRNGMEWDAFFASDLIGAYKPSKEAYQTAIKALELKPSECIMVAAHVYDLKAAAHNGMRTVYIKRSTEDRDVNLSDYSFDMVIQRNGLIGLAEALVD